VRPIAWKGRRAVQSTVTDITLRKEYEERLQRQANFDWITDLPNRVLALDRLNNAVIGARRHDRKVGLLYIDLDYFKKVNDTLGHAAGDQLLRQAAQRIVRCVREEDTVARLSGDEFTIVLPDINVAMDTETVANKILDAFTKPFDLDGQEAFVTASIGVTVCPDDGDDPSVLMQNADAAMYRAKEQGRNTYQFFTSELNARAVERVRIERHLRHALERDQLSVHYQPLIDLGTGRIVCAEALLRWQNPEIGQVTPDQFVALAEDTGLIVPIGEWVLQTACRQLSRWRIEGLPALCLSVNISSRQFRGKGLVNAVCQALKDNAISPRGLQLEITEGLLMDDLPETKEALHELQNIGVRLAVDDFGTGYSSLSYLKRFPVSALKIDKSFIRDIPADRGDATLVEAIVAMAHRLNLQVIGEGIETKKQLDFIRSRSCDLAQGHYFSEPISGDDFGKLLRSWENGDENLASVSGFGPA
jgi:diguanylate cyclase (GGDEF)-like protein